MSETGMASVERNVFVLCQFHVDLFIGYIPYTTELSAKVIFTDIWNWTENEPLNAVKYCVIHPFKLYFSDKLRVFCSRILDSTPF